MRFSYLAFVALLPCAAFANEEWDGPNGLIAWDIDIDGTAVFSMPYAAETYRVYLPGLTSTLEERGAFYGYYIVDGGNSDCGPELIGPDGVKSVDWGSVVLTFDRFEYPSGWTAFLGPCFDNATFPVRAEPNLD